MSVDRESRPAAFQQLSRQLDKLAGQPSPKNVHRFRTLSRRVEALVGEPGTNLGRKQKKILKMLGKLRKQAGQVRDLDVQIAALRNLKIPQEPGGKSRFLRALVEERVRREKKLSKAFRQETVLDVRKRLKRIVQETEFLLGKGAVSQALRIFHEVGIDHAPVTEEKLHQYRIVGKRARYLAELGGKDLEAQRLVRELKRLQDVIGDWHDWWKLTQKAQKYFGEVKNSAVAAALNNVTRAKFRQALDALTEARAALSPKKAISLSNKPSATKEAAA